MQEVEEARERGWAVDNERYVIGAASIAVPVLNDRGEAAFAFSATMFSAHCTPERAESLASELRRPAQLLSAALPHL
jgi:DNA-binding IclR family transcriptional regulator